MNKRPWLVNMVKIKQNYIRKTDIPNKDMEENVRQRLVFKL